MPELLRLKAEVIQRSGGDKGASIVVLGEALALARQQGARAWELKAGIDLATLFAATERRAEAVALLDTICSGGATNGETADARRAHQLRESLRSETAAR